MLNNVLEAIGLLMVAAFAWFVWPPLVLLVVGLALVVVAALRERSTRRRPANQRGADLR